MLMWLFFIIVIAILMIASYKYGKGELEKERLIKVKESVFNETKEINKRLLGKDMFDKYFKEKKENKDYIPLEEVKFKRKEHVVQNSHPDCRASADRPAAIEQYRQGDPADPGRSPCRDPVHTYHRL